MKKMVFIIAMLTNIGLVSAQNYAEISIFDIPQGESWVYCTETYDGAIIHGVPECDMNVWYVNGEQMLGESIIVYSYNQSVGYVIDHEGCDLWKSFVVGFDPSFVENPFNEPNVWKRAGETITIGRDLGHGTTYLWSTNENTPTIDLSQPGTYSVTITDLCGSQTFSVEVRNNVELYRATVDLSTNLNKVTWQTTPEQAEYIGQVKVERDGMVVGTAPYEDGQFIDNIGSENAARNYRLTGIDTNGNECPIPSYQKGTLHVDYSPNASNPNKLNMAWTPPFIEEGAPISVSYFQICKYDPTTGEVTVVDQIGANNTIGSYDVNLFDGGYATVAALFSEGKDYEDVAFSNLTEEVLGVGENDGNPVRVYPNPANGRFTVEGTGMMRITNVLGQEIIAKEIDGKETVALPKGLYFVQLNGAVQKVVVE